AIERVAPTTAPVLITGETGTGKELAARRIHCLSGVAAGPFVTMNCAAIPESLVESELFGYRRGAFTGAERDRRGKFQEADGGTLLLDEIGDMPPAVQAKLLRVLQDGVVEPLGGGGVAVTVRVLAATHRDLRAMVAAETFREDLLFRLRVIEIEMPPLRERGEDVVLLARLFLDELSARPLRLTPEAEHALRAYRWPGNVRELRNAVERAMIFSRGGIVQLDDLPSEVAAVAESEPDGEESLIAWKPGEDFRTAKERVIERFERAIISAALRDESGNISGAAKALGLHRQNLQQKLRQLGIDAQRFNPERR
ncbi:MAG: AAA domain-containing protein, partial [bacterium]|nr:AAA domain-containing protein [bacterium]